MGHEETQAETWIRYYRDRLRDVAIGACSEMDQLSTKVEHVLRNGWNGKIGKWELVECPVNGDGLSSWPHSYIAMTTPTGMEAGERQNRKRICGFIYTRFAVSDQ